MELQQQDEQLTESRAISLDVKLAFSRLTSLIHTLKDDIGQEAANYQMLRIRNDIRKVLKSKKNKGFFQEEIEIKKKDEIEFVEFLHPSRELGTANTTLKTNGTHNFPSQNKNSSIIYHNQLNNGSSFSNSKNDELFTTFLPSFRPTIKKTVDLENCVDHGIVNEKSSPGVNNSVEEVYSEEEEKKGVKTKKSSPSFRKNEKNVEKIQVKEKRTRKALKVNMKSRDIKNKKTNDTSKSDSKKSMSVIDSKNSDEINLEKNKNNNNSKNGLDKEAVGPFPEIFEGESSFILPLPCLTTDDLLESIKKNVIKGRYTPPTSMFDNVYGNKSLDSSSVNTSFDDIGMKNNHVVKRMCKVNKKPKAKQNNTSSKHTMNRDEAIHEILKAATTRTNTTPSIIKEVFCQDKADDPVNFSDLSDIEDVS